MHLYTVNTELELCVFTLEAKQGALTVPCTQEDEQRGFTVH